MTSDDVLNVRRRGPVAIFEINRPEAKNTLDPSVLSGLAASLDSIRHDDSVRAVIMTGAGDTFCAGADTVSFGGPRDEALIGRYTTLCGSIWTDLGDCPKPVIAAVEGLALGAGCELALACDVVIAGASSRFAFPDVRVGAIPGGGTQRLMNAVGKYKAMALLLTGDMMAAEAAHIAGLVTEVVPNGNALPRAVSMAGRIAMNSPLAVALAKDAASRAFETSLTQGLEHEKRNFHVALGSIDFQEGRRAFFDRRAPEFVGR